MKRPTKNHINKTRLQHTTFLSTCIPIFLSPCVPAFLCSSIMTIRANSRAFAVHLGDSLDNFGAVLAHFGAVSVMFGHTKTPQIRVFNTKNKENRSYKIICVNLRKTYLAEVYGEDGSASKNGIRNDTQTQIDKIFRVILRILRLSFYFWPVHRKICEICGQTLFFMQKLVTITCFKVYCPNPVGKLLY